MIKNDKEQIIANTNEEIAKVLIRYFNKPIKRNKPNDEATLYHRKVQQFMENYVINNNDKYSITNRPFTKQEVLNRISNLNLASAMACDMISYRLIDICKNEIVIYLTMLLNALYEQGYVPFNWRLSEYIPVPKPGRDSSKMSNIRPIQMTPGFARIMNGLLSDRLLYETILREKIKIRANNTAFQMNRNTEDIYLALVEKIFRAIENGHFLELAFMDLKSAYDSVWIDALLYKLIYKYKFDGKLIAWLHHYFYNRYNRVKFNNITSDWHKALPNLPQGDPISPILFVIFLNDYVGKNMDIDFSNFADDCTLEMNTKSGKSNLTNLMKFNMRKSLQEEIDHFYQFTLNNKLVLKKIKCNTVSFSNKNKFKAYVYKIEGKKLDLIHDLSHAPRKCHHSEKYCFLEGMGYNEFEDSNGESDLEFLDPISGNKKRNNVNHCGENNCDNDCVISEYGTNCDIDNSECIEINDNDGNCDNDSVFNDILNIIDDSFEPNFFDFSNSKYKKKDKSRQLKFMHENKFSDTVRILGVHFDPKLNFKKHIEVTMDRIRKDIFKLKRISKSKYYKIGNRAIWKIWMSTIRPKIEYALCTVSSASNLNVFDKIQSRIAKFSEKIKNLTPTLFANDLMNVKTMHQRLEEMQVKVWNKYARAPPHLMQAVTFNKWKQYIKRNGGKNSYTRITRSGKYGNEDNFNVNCFKYVSKSPLSRAYNTIKSITPAGRKVFKNKLPQVMRPPPIYSNPFPTNIVYRNLNNEKNVNNIIQNEYAFHTRFFSDGSCKPNPGPGGSAYYAENFIKTQRLEAINCDTTINFAEFNSIKMILIDIIDHVCDRSKNNFWYNKDIAIFSDAAFVCNILNMTSYPKHNYLYRIIDECIGYCNILDFYNIKLEIVKIRSHSGINGNKLADLYANQAADAAVENKNRNDGSFQTKYNPISVDISFGLQKIRKKHQKLRKEKWKNYKFDLIEEKNKGLRLSNDNERKQSRFFVNCDMLFVKAMFDENGNVRNIGNKLKAELYGLENEECEIINKLRTEYINLNNFKYYFFKETAGTCFHCPHEIDSVSHLLLDCTMNESKFYPISKIRYKFLKDLRKLHMHFKNLRNFNAMDILFPHTWLLNPYANDRKFK